METLLLGLAANLTAESILKFIGIKTGTAMTEWLKKEVMSKVFGIEDTLGEVKHILTNMQEEMVRINNTLTSITKEIKWEHLNTRIFDAESDICFQFELLLSILSLSKEQERKKQMELLKTGVLNTNRGVLRNMNVINEILVGNGDGERSEKGLLEMWSENVYNNMLTNPRSAKTYTHHVMNYLTKYATVQFYGMTLFLLANESDEFGTIQYSRFKTNLGCQIDLMLKTMPNGTMILADPNEDNKFVFHINYLFGIPMSLRSTASGRIETNVDSNIDDGTWIFERSGTFDTDGSLLITGYRKRSYLSVSGKDVKCVAEKHLAHSFYVMPHHSTDNSRQIIICPSKPCDVRFLGLYLESSENKEILTITDPSSYNTAYHNFHNDPLVKTIGIIAAIFR